MRSPNGNDVPESLWKIAIGVAKVVGDPKTRDEWRSRLRDWANSQRAKSLRDDDDATGSFFPIPLHVSDNAKLAYLTAVHDMAADAKSQLAPWSHTDGAEMVKGVPFTMLLVELGDGVPAVDVERLNQFLKDVERESGSTPSTSTSAGAPTMATREQTSIDTQSDATDRFIIARNGDGYDFDAFGERGHFKQSRGFTYLWKLLESSGRAVAVVDLVREGANNRSIDEPEEGQQEGQEWERFQGSVQPTLDREGRVKLDERIRELEEEIANEKSRHNWDRQVLLETEKNEIEAHISKSLGLLGRLRDMNNPVAQLSRGVHNALRRAYKKLRIANPPLPTLAQHLEANIDGESGTFKYAPTPLPPWLVLPYPPEISRDS